MHLFLIRHGETTDNVAGLYAGVRDSPLTTHGILQTSRLATHLSSLFTISHIFSSNLTRAVKTAEALRDAQKHTHDMDVDVVQVMELREKNFGSGEGERFGQVPKGSAKRRPHVGAETGEEMRKRADRFLDEHLLPLLDSEADESSACVVAVVAHGLILSSLFKALYSRTSSQHFTFSSEVRGSSFSLQNGMPLLPSWSNTGFLEAKLTSLPPRNSDGDSAQPRLTSTNPHYSDLQERQSPIARLHISQVNATSHLSGLRRTKGGIGSSKYDEKQKTISSFFLPTTPKKRKLETPTASAMVRLFLLC